MPTFGSLFSGIGGIDLGLERAGWECRWQVEIDDYCRRVLAKHWPDVPKLGDIKQLDGSELEQVDLIAGGFPCQPVSVAGRRLAQADPRWLWPEFARIVRVVRPRYVLVENVPGLLRRGMGDVLGDLAALGFDAEWSVLSACTMGAPHARERLFLFAYANSLRCWSWRDTRHHDGRFHHWEAAQGQSQWKDMERWIRTTFQDGYWDEAATSVQRVADGVPHRVDRLTALGNAVVPQVAEWVGRRLIKVVAARGDQHETPR